MWRWAPAALIVLFAGGAAWGDCSVYVDGLATYGIVDADGNPRNNPDNTLYPNDMFGFEFSYGFSSECIDPHVGVVADSGAVLKHAVRGPQNSRVPAGSGTVSGEAAILVGEANRCHGAPAGGGGGRDGYDTKPGQPRRCGGLSLTVWAYKIVCGQDCRKVRVSATDGVYPDVVAPMADITLERHMLRDMQGYPAVNLDGTYYAWDPAAIVHAARFIHKDARAGTISFLYERAHPGLYEEGGFGCDHVCRRDLAPDGAPAGTGFLPYPGEYGNGDGAYAYAAPAGAPHGAYTITYRVEIQNEGAPINSHHNRTRIDVVGYDPVFVHYPYTVLADGAHRAYEDRQGVLLRYEGSADEQGIHPDRRAKITNFYPHTVARSAAGLEPLGLNGSEMAWNSSWAPPHDGGYPGAAESFAAVMGGSPALPPHPVNTTSAGGCPPETPARHHPFGCHMMFLHASHGAVRFWQDVGAHVLPESPRWYDDVTTRMGLASDDWAGRLRHTILNYTYAYPHALLAHNFTMESPQGIVLKARVTPYTGEGNRTEGRVVMHTDGYVFEKTLHDTGDHTMAGMAASEVYHTVQNGTGVGTLRMSLNKTALQFWNMALAAQGYDSIMEMSVREALHMGAHHTFELSAGPHARQFVAPFGFDVSRTERVHVGHIPAEVRRVGPDTIQFMVPYEFGTVYGLAVRGEYRAYGGECHAAWCAATVGPAGGALQVHNAWGGTASAAIPPHEGTPSIEDPTPQYEALAAMAAPLAGLGLGMYAAWRVIRNMRGA